MTQPGWNQQSPWQRPEQGQQPVTWSYGQPSQSQHGQPQHGQPQYPQPPQVRYGQGQYAPVPQGPTGQPWGPPGGVPVGQPPRRGSAVRWVVGGLLALTVIAFGALIITNLIGGDSTSYQNEDYAVPPPDLSPPPIPMTKSSAEAKQWTDENAFYAQTVPQPIRCDASRVDDVPNASDSQVQAHLDALTACLMRTWATPMSAAGFTAVRPSVTIYGQYVDTGCGELDYINAVYCAADQQVYYSRQLFELVPEVQDKNSVAVDFVIAHEFGHAIQARTGILYGRAIQQQDATKSAALQINRRFEMQADCFSGMFMRSVAQSLALDAADVTTIKQSLRAVGDPANKEGDHGQADNREFWGLTGFATDRVASCNTYAASADQVR